MALGIIPTENGPAIPTENLTLLQKLEKDIERAFVSVHQEGYDNPRLMFGIIYRFLIDEFQFITGISDVDATKLMCLEDQAFDILRGFPA